MVIELIGKDQHLGSAGLATSLSAQPQPLLASAILWLAVAIALSGEASTQGSALLASSPLARPQLC